MNTISAFPAPISVPQKLDSEEQEEQQELHEVPVLPHGGWLAEKAQLFSTAWYAWLDRLRSPTGPAPPTVGPRIASPSDTPYTSSSGAAPAGIALEPAAGTAFGEEPLPLGKQVVNAAHSIMEHLGQDAAAVSGTLRDEADEFRGHHTGLHTASEKDVPTDIPEAAKPVTSEHLSLASQLKNAVHSTLDHLGQETAAVSSSVKDELTTLKHHDASPTAKQ